MTRDKPQGHRPTNTTRIELRATEADYDLLDRSDVALGTDRSSFLLNQGRLAAPQVLTARELFMFDVSGKLEWKRINNCPARSLPGLTRLLKRPSPFS